MNNGVFFPKRVEWGTSTTEARGLVIGDQVVVAGPGEDWQRTWYVTGIDGDQVTLQRGDDQEVPVVAAASIEAVTMTREPDGQE